MRLLKMALACVVVLGTMAKSAQAEVIFSNFGPGDTYTTGFSFDITSPPANNNSDRDAAMGFTIAGINNFTLNSIELAVFNPGNNLGGGNIMDVFLTTDAAGIPGSVIDSFQLTLPVPEPFFQGILSANSTLNPTLYAGTQYWIYASAQQPNSYLGWSFDIDGFFSDNGPTLVRANGDPWQEYPIGQAAFRLGGDPQAPAVPEPSTIALLLTGGMGLIGYRWRRRQQLAA